MYESDEPAEIDNEDIPEMYLDMYSKERMQTYKFIYGSVIWITTLLFFYFLARLFV